MKINGEIGQEVLLSGRIKKIFVDEDGKVEYDVNVTGSDFGIWRPASDIIFKTAEEVLDEELSAEELIFSDPDKEWVIRDENATDCDDNATDCDSSETEEESEEWFTVEQPKKKRGRPRKATVEDLMKRAKE